MVFELEGTNFVLAFAHSLLATRTLQEAKFLTRLFEKWPSFHQQQRRWNQKQEKEEEEEEREEAK